MNKKISVIIAAYNEEPRIAKVLKIVENHPLIDEVIVINDGSKDNTIGEIKKFNVTLIDNEHNMGKTLSIKRGIEAARNEIIMFLDADLVGLNAKTVEKLARPVLDGKVDWTLSLRGNSFSYMKFMGMDWVSGERVITKTLLSDPLIWSRPKIGFGLETLMNKSLLAHNTKFYSVYLPELKITNKAAKIGFIKGWIGEIRMLGQIAKVMPLPLVVGQFLKMARLSKKYKKQEHSNS